MGYVLSDVEVDARGAERPDHLGERLIDRRREPRRLLHGAGVRVHAHDLGERAALDVELEDVEVVAAEEREGARLGELVPELLECDRRRLLPAPPEHVDHLAEGPDRPAGEARARLVHEAADDLPEPLR